MVSIAARWDHTSEVTDASASALCQIGTSALTSVSFLRFHEIRTAAAWQQGRQSKRIFGLQEAPGLVRWQLDALNPTVAAGRRTNAEACQPLTAAATAASSRGPGRRSEARNMAPNCVECRALTVCAREFDHATARASPANNAALSSHNGRQPRVARIGGEPASASAMATGM